MKEVLKVVFWSTPLELHSGRIVGSTFAGHVDLLDVWLIEGGDNRNQGRGGGVAPLSEHLVLISSE